MSMNFKCPQCDNETKRLVYPLGGDVGCDKCVERKDSSAKGLLHTSANNKWAKWMTMADKLNITTRDRCPDGRNRPNWRWR